MEDWVIRSKLAPSVQLRWLIDRDDLVACLERVLDARAAVLHAPAGYGKTSLLALWRRLLADRGVPVAWLSLDDHDRDPLQFLTYLVESLKAGELIPASTSGLPVNASGMSAYPPEAIVSAMLVELSRRDRESVLILDDFHRAETGDNCRVVNQLLAVLPPSIHVVISTREFPAALSLADMRARDELIEIDQASLQFTESEIRTYLGSLVEGTEDPDWSDQLHARTEGWPIALQTVRRWVSEGATLRDTLDQISGRSSDLSDYFLEQVFDNLDVDEQVFLLRTSILERVDGDLANHLCNNTASWEILEGLERRDLFVQALDRERRWYRYHRLFSEFLQERLRRRGEGIVTDLHRLASEWFLDRGFVNEAVQHALESGQSGFVADLFEHLGGWHYVLQGHVGAVQKALALIDDEHVRSHPRVWLAKVFTTVRHGDVERAEALFEELSVALDHSGCSDSQLLSELVFVRSILNVYGDRSISDAEIARLEQLSETLPHDNNPMHAVRYNLLCAMYAQRGSFDDCMAAGDKAIRRFRAMGSVWGETFIYFHEGYACMAQGRLRDAEVLYQVGLDLALEHFGENSDLAAIGGAFLAEAAYERNSTHEASRLLELALPHIERFDAWPEVYVAAYTTAMKLARAESDTDKLEELRRRGRATATNRGLPRLRAIVDMQADEIRQRERCRALAESGPTRRHGAADTAEHPVLSQLRVSITARTLVERGDSDAAVELLVRACRQSRANRLMRSYLSFSVLLATVLWAKGAHEKALCAFEDALFPSLFEGAKRVFIDEGDELVHVIHDLVHASGKKRGNRLRDRFLAELLMEIDAASLQPGRHQDALSPREQEVLRFLIQGRSNREIAEGISISINTVKFHVKNIFDKLGVTTRKDAVSASIRRGLS